MVMALSTEHIILLRNSVQRAAILVGTTREADHRFLANLALQAFYSGIMEPEGIAHAAAFRFSKRAHHDIA